MPSSNLRRVSPFCILAAWVALGCGRGGEALFPLDTGNQWLYNARYGSVTAVETIKVSGTTPVDGQNATVLEGPLGRSVLFWNGDALYASQLPGTRFEPPLPLATALEANGPPRKWQGLLTTAFGSQSAVASLECKRESLELAGQKVRALKATLDMTTSKGTLQLTTWFLEGRGPVRQEQRADGRLERSLELLSGP